MAGSVLLNEFKEKRDNYVALENKAYSIIKEMIEENNFFVMEIPHRTKAVDSLAGKLERKSGKYKKLTDITDLVGIRIICYFSDTVDAIAQKLTNVFDIDWENSIDKRATISATQFGYLSLHYVCSLGDKVDCEEAIKGIPFEIQIKTVLQHAWAEIEHDLGYKSGFGVPRVVRRSFSQIAGLLEVADKQFVEVRNGSIEYTEQTRQKLENDEGDDIFLDKVSLREYLRVNKKIQEFLAILKKELHVDTEESTSDNLLEQLSWFGVETIGQVSKMFADNKDYVYGKIKELVNEYEIDIISINAIFRYVFHGELISQKYSEEQMRKFFSLTMYDAEKIEKQIKKLRAL